MAQPLSISHLQGARGARSLVRLLPLLGALAVSMVLATMYGDVAIPAGETLSIVGAHLHLVQFHSTAPAGDDAIIWSIRLPRVIGVSAIGAALALAGLLFQAVLRNPLADPYVIGTSAGAQLGVTAAILSPISFTVLGFGPLQIAANS